MTTEREDEVEDVRRWALNLSEDEVRGLVRGICEDHGIDVVFPPGPEGQITPPRKDSVRVIGRIPDRGPGGTIPPSSFVLWGTRTGRIPD